VRTGHTTNWTCDQPIAHRLAALTVVGAVGAILWSMLMFELVRFASTRRDVRNGALRTD
jgi:hypothetical protein